MTNQEFTSFYWNVPHAVAALIDNGWDSPRLFRAYKTSLKDRFKDNPSLAVLSYDVKVSKPIITGSNLLVTGMLNGLLKDSGVRVAVPSDDYKGDISRLVKGKFYTDFNAGVVGKDEPTIERNRGLWRNAIELAEEAKGTVRFPFMFQGFTVAPNKKEKGYGLKIVPASNFAIIEDGVHVFSEKNNRKRFYFDSAGIPRIDGKGKMTLYTSNEGLSRLCLGRGLVLDSYYGYLADSNDDGRVVLVKDAEGVVQKNKGGKK